MKQIKQFEEFTAQNAVDEAYAGNISDFKYDLEMAIEELGLPTETILRVSKKGRGYEVRMSSYMSQRNAWEKLGEIIGATLVDFKADPKSINVGVYESNEENIQEGIDLNDPVLVALRASKEDRAKKVVAQKERMKKRVYGKQREKLENDLWIISIDLKDAYAERRDLYNDMESEAGEKGDNWNDDDANRYGRLLNEVDSRIESLLKKRQEIEIKLAY